MPRFDARISIAIVSQGQTPYRNHLHRRIAAKLPEARLWSLFTHETGSAAWAYEDAQEIGSVLFGKGETTSSAKGPAKQMHEFAKAGRIIDWLGRNHVDAVVLCGYADVGRVRILRWCRRSGIPVLFSSDSNIRCDTAEGFKRAVKNIYVRWVLRQMTAFLPCGTMGQAFYERYGARADRCFFFPYIPDFAQIQSIAPQEIADAMRKYNLQADRRYLVYSGRMIPLKRIDLLIKAFTTIAQERRNWDLLMIGDGQLRTGLESQVPAELRRRVIWTGFIGNQREISALYRCADALALCSNYEAWSLVLIEAAAAGLALISSDIVGAAPEILEDHANGRLFASENLGALTEALRDVTDPRNIDRMKAASCSAVAQWRTKADPVEGLRQALALCLPGKVADDGSRSTSLVSTRDQP